MDTAIQHPAGFVTRRFWNWFPMGLTYALLYMGRYNLTVSKNALGDLMSKTDFGTIFGVGAGIYAFSFLINGPLIDRIGGKKGILLAAAGTCLANLAMGLYLLYVLGLEKPAEAPLKWVFTGLYAVNMYFQSYGAVSIVKVNSNWFHLRERGTFSGIFGVMISSGVFLAFDVSSRILASGLVLGQGYSGGDAIWWVFLTPALALAAFFVIEFFLLRDRPQQAGFTDFDPGDASSGEDMSKPLSSLALYKRILTNPILLTVAAIEFCTGVLRNGIMHWFPIYASEKLAAIYKSLHLSAEQIAQAKVDFPALLQSLGLSAERQASLLAEAGGWDATLANWGLLLMIAGIIGGNVAGLLSDKLFQSRRAPSAAFLYGLLALCTLGMAAFMENGWLLGGCVLLMSLGVIGTHGLLSGTASMDFGGRRGAATAVGVIDGAVYLGTSLQSLSLGYLTTQSWSFWPWFLLPFSIVGLILLFRIWNAKPKGQGAH